MAARNMDSSYGRTVAEQFVDICVRVPQVGRGGSCAAASRGEIRPRFLNVERGYPKP